MIIKKFLKSVLYLPKSSAVLMFHHVSLNPKVDRSGCKLSTDDFKKQINKYNNYGSLKEILSKNIKNKIAITFDDGLEDVYFIAYPFLVERNIPFTIFVTTEFIDKKGYITTDQLLEMSENPLVSVGSHGITHDVLINLSYKDKFVEINKSKQFLEKILSKKIDIFAYSHGQFDDECIKILRESDYYYAMGVIGYPLNIFTRYKKYNIPRLNIDSNSISVSNSKLQKIFKR